MRIFARTDTGKAREMNEDFYYVCEEIPNAYLCILADGMGGYNGGEIASSLATDSVRKYIVENFKRQDYSKEEIQDIIKRAIEHANKIVKASSKRDEELELMGTTLEVCLIYNNRAFIGHIGDSRIYRIRQNIIRRITTDHSYVEKLVKDGTITKEEASHHPEKNVLMKALGTEEEANPDVMVKGFQESDIILMCSDGLTNMLAEEEIYNIIVEDVESAADRLINEANNLGGYDNITVIIMYNV